MNEQRNLRGHQRVDHRATSGVSRVTAKEIGWHGAEDVLHERASSRGSEATSSSAMVWPYAGRGVHVTRFYLSRVGDRPVTGRRWC
jgi:hypothetical protein